MIHTPFPISTSRTHNYLPAAAGLSPPRNFRSAIGVSRVATSRSPFRAVKTATGTAAQKRGKQYEKKVLSRLLVPSVLAKLGFTVDVSPWFCFDDVRATGRHCQPDFILSSAERTIIGEVKYSHCLEAYWQLEQLYRPVVVAMHPRRRVSLLVVVKRFDPAVAFPIPIQLCTSLDEALASDGQAVPVLLWIP